MKVIGCQWDLAWEDPAANFLTASHLVEGDSADLIILPEMFSTGYSMDVAKVIEPEDFRTEAFLGELAARRGAAVLGGLVRADDEGIAGNELVAFGDDQKELCRYRKNRPFPYTGESEVYARGKEVEVFDWRGWKVAPLICYDLRFPELFRRVTAKGAELIVVIASWPSVRVDHWVTLLRARAIENLAYVVGVNRCGSDPQFDYPGRSLVVDPWGEVVADAGRAEGSVRAELDLNALRAWRNEFPALEDLET
ncbi:MAG: nitrilase-related carbon-nitrogen hydrolase [Verrucomicrobiota bacterium]